MAASVVLILALVSVTVLEAQLHHAEVTSGAAQVEVSSHGQLMRLEHGARDAVEDRMRSAFHESSAAEDWVICQHFVRTEAQTRECAFDTCAVECGNCTQDDQCESGFYCSQTLKKCVDSEELECREPTAHCQKDGTHCSAVFHPDNWVKYPHHCLSKGAHGVRGGFKLIANGVDIGTLTTSPKLEKALQRALKTLGEVQYDARWIGVETSLSENDMEAEQAYVRFRLPVPGPVRREAKKEDVQAALERGNEEELHSLLTLELKKEGAPELSYHVNIGEYEVMGALLPARTTTTEMHTDAVLDTTSAAAGSSTTASSTAESSAHGGSNATAEGHVQNDASSIYGGSGHGTASEFGKADTSTGHVDADKQLDADTAGSGGTTTVTTTHPWASAKSFFSDMTWWKVILIVVAAAGVLGSIAYGVQQFMAMPEDQGRLDLIAGDVN